MTSVQARKLAGIPLALALVVSTGAASVEDLRGTVRVGTRTQGDAVVWLETTLPPAGDAPRPVLDQRNLTFSPHVLAVRVGTTVELPNNDLVFHNVFSFHDGKKFDLGLYPVGTKKRLTFERAGLSRLFCNIHPAMAAYIMAVDSAYFAVSDKDGRFAIRNVPPGTYTYHAWRPGGEILTGSVTVEAGAPLEVRWP
jgi:plastocyanin